MKSYAVTVFLGSFLLFQVQPLIGKSILPWYGGAPAVWTTCLLFFQLALVAGYAYAHTIVSFFTLRQQAIVHVCLICVALALLPILPPESWKPISSTAPTFSILLLLLASIGGPYLVLASTAPLIQAWFGQTHPGSSPYRLYALSNAASLLALLTYPFLIEHALTLPSQSIVWSASFVMFGISCTICAARAFRYRESRLNDNHIQSDDADARAESRPDVANLAMWLGLSACGVVLLMSTTNQLCQEVAAVPFLWVLPLAIYLITFIICFDKESWYNRNVFSFALIIGVFGACLALAFWQKLSLISQLAVCTFTLFACCMCCHGELIRSKPDSRFLTLFYLLIAVGGAAGGIFVAVIAPILFNGFDEYPLGLFASCLLVVLARRHEAWKNAGRPQGGRIKALRFAAIATAIAIALRLATDAAGTSEHASVLAKRRDFYGCIHVKKVISRERDWSYLTMYHGITSHGSQFLADTNRKIPTTYYVPESGVGIAINRHPKRSTGMKIGVIGLGVGTIAAYAESIDSLSFYEINQTVVDLADEFFSFQRDAIERGADLKLHVGDARIILEQQKSSRLPQKFDVLVVDAFSSDAIPIHLMTKECFELYWYHLKPDGILAVHVSNRYLDLNPVVRSLGKDLSKTVVQVKFRTPEKRDGFPSDWILMTNNEEFLQDESVMNAVSSWEGSSRHVRWTDHSSSLFSVLRLRRIK